MRPTGVTVLAVLAFLFAAFHFIGGLALALGSAAFLPPVFGLVGAAAGAVMIVLGVVQLLIGWGLWSLKEWARILGLVLAGIAAVTSLMGIFAGDFFTSAIGIVLNGVVLWYLLRPEVKMAFRRA